MDSDDREQEIEETLLEKFSAGSFVDIIQTFITSLDDEEELEEEPRFLTELRN